MKRLKTAPSVFLTKPATRKCPSATSTASANPVRNDPILQELWAIKTAINKEANYDAATLLRSAQSVVNEMRAV
jgi:hypothetical protein